MSDLSVEKSFAFYPGHPGHRWKPAWLQTVENAPISAPVSAIIPDAPSMPLTPPKPQPKTSRDLTEDEYEQFAERRSIMHYDGGLEWDEAERLALEEVLAYDADAYLAVIRAASPGPAPVVTEART